MKQILFIIYIVTKTPGKLKEKLVWLKTLLKVEIFKTDKVKVNGFPLVANNYNSFRVLYREVFIEKEYSFYTSNEAPVIFDCGANVGFSTVFFKKQYPKAIVVCFEPSPESFAILEKNVLDNNIKNVELVNVALTNYNGNINFYVNKEFDLMSGTLSERSHGSVYECKAKKLSEYTKKYQRIDLVKIDIEGAEMDVIKEIKEAGQLDKIDQFIIEFHHNTGDSRLDLAEFLDIFTKQGFGYSLQSKYLKLGEFQDILIHFFKR